MNLTVSSASLCALSAAAFAWIAASSSQPWASARRAAEARTRSLLLLIRHLVLGVVVEVLVPLLLLGLEELVELGLLRLGDRVLDLLHVEDVDREEASRPLLALGDHLLLADFLVVAVEVLPGDLLELLAVRVLDRHVHGGDEADHLDRRVVE